VLRTAGSGTSMVGGPGADRLQAESPAAAAWPDEAGAVEVDLRAGVARTAKARASLCDRLAAAGAACTRWAVAV
jgi:hypothetical protein